MGITGPLVLVTMSCPDAGVRATVSHSVTLELNQTRPVLNLARLHAFLVQLGVPPVGRFQLDVDLPVGGGAGMSTAALVAVAQVVGADPDLIAGACLAIEGASDPLMEDIADGVLWAPRQAQVLTPMAKPPAAEVVGGFWGAPITTDPTDQDFPEVEDLVRAWANAPDIVEAAKLATESAARTAAMRGPGNEPTLDVAASLGALGIARAHTGSARAFIFAPGTVPRSAASLLEETGFKNIIRFRTGHR